jgi:hypothetical protein
MPLAAVITAHPPPWASPAVRKVFLNVDDLLGPTKLLAQLGVLLLQAKHAPVGRLDGIGFGAARFALQRRHLERLDLLPPFAQMRAVQSLATQQRANCAGIAACIGFAHDSTLVTGRELPAARNGDNLCALAFVILFYSRRHLVFHVIPTSLISLMKLSHSSLTQGVASQLDRVSQSA